MKVYFKISKSELDPNANIFLRSVHAPSNAELEELVKQYGEVLSCMLKFDEQAKPLGYGYV